MIVFIRMILKNSIKCYEHLNAKNMVFCSNLNFVSDKPTYNGFFFLCLSEVVVKLVLWYFILLIDVHRTHLIEFLKMPITSF